MLSGMSRSQPQPPPGDVRMRGFTRRATVEDALAWLDARLAPLPPEPVSITAAAGRVLAGPVTSGVDVPGFDRAMMDGFAVRAADTQGASAYNRLPLSVAGEALPGRFFTGGVARGRAVLIMTGAPVPDGADAVLPAEKVDIDGDTIHVLAAVSPGRHVGRRGEDVAAGKLLLPAGRKLRPQDAGVLSSVGAGEVSVVRRPRVFREIPRASNSTCVLRWPPMPMPKSSLPPETTSTVATILARRTG